MNCFTILIMEVYRLHFSWKLVKKDPVLGCLPLASIVTIHPLLFMVLKIEGNLKFSGEDDFIVDDENQPVREKTRKKGGKVQDRFAHISSTYFPKTSQTGKVNISLTV